MLDRQTTHTNQALDDIVPSASSTCAVALRNISRLSEMSAATREAVETLQGLVAICNDAGSVVRDIRQKIDGGTDAADPDELVDALARLNEMSAAVKRATQAADGNIVAFTATSR